ncbi:hypothetical protein PLICRDRAFT_164045 [Plicaturopsis crispa FD-325 SS-3]|nr:hypothetical protein PLICRDRAFT_164045 [Plicaturopsis crispa FD-325 SS-3]
MPRDKKNPILKRKRLARREVSEVETNDSDAPDRPGENKRVRWEGKDEDTDTVAADDEVAKKDTVCLAASCIHGRVGCAYYDPVKCIIYVLEDTQETPHFDLTRMILEQANADAVFTSSKADDAFIDVLRDHMDESSGFFQIRPHKDFVAGKGRDRILSLQLLSELPMEQFEAMRSSDSGSHSDASTEPKNAYDFMRKHRDATGDPTLKRWNASIRLANFASLESSPLCLASVGALLDQMARERAVSELEDEGIGGLEVRDIESLTLDKVMQINADALFSLQIFENESHASVHSDKTKEGLSLFGILNHTTTTLGRSLLRTWFLRPALSLSVINARHDALACFLRPENLVTSDVMHNHLKGIKNVPRIMCAMRAGKAGISEWQGLVKFAFHSAMIRDALTELHQAGHVEIIAKLIDVLDIASFRDVGNAVNETIEWEESVNESRVCVKPHIDDELDRRKHVYHGIDAVLSKVADKMAKSVPADHASSLNVVYFPQLGFLICLPMLEEWAGDAGIKVIDGWTFQFSSETHVYFKCQEMQDMDTHIGDLLPAIVDRELEIIQGLLEKILEHDEAMTHACDVCAELDCLLSFAEASRAYDYCRPVMVEENVMNIVQGRHPLQEQVVDAFVPNDTVCVGGVGFGSSFPVEEDDDGREQPELNSVIICTGANACGKSVCFVPAESATLGVVDKIFTRVQTRESVSKVQSAFMIDLNQVSLALRNSTERSLIILDEFGKGTVSTGSTSANEVLTSGSGLGYDPVFAPLSFSWLSTTSEYTDGAGLFCGVIKSLLERGSGCPKVLAATHFHEVFDPELLDPREGALPITFVHMEIMFTSDRGELLDIKSAPNTSGQFSDDEDDEDLPARVIAPGEKVTYLYRVAPGLALASHAAQCAALFGIPKRVVERAQHVTRLLTTNELRLLLDEAMTAEEERDLEDAEAMCRRYLAWDFSAEDGDVGSGGVRAKMAEVLGRALDVAGDMDIDMGGGP